MNCQDHYLKQLKQKKNKEGYQKFLRITSENHVKAMQPNNNWLQKHQIILENQE